jgi:hypothetical protein
MWKFAEKFHPGDSIGFAYGLRITRRRTFTPISRCVRARRKVATWDAARRATAAPNPKGKGLIKSWFGRENAVGENPSIYRGNGSRGAIREARATIVLATQAYTSIHTP